VAPSPAPRQHVHTALDHTAKEITMTTNIKLKLIGLFTTVALFALLAADALASRSWV
jgi:hypothetical protein